MIAEAYKVSIFSHLTYLIAIKDAHNEHCGMVILLLYVVGMLEATTVTGAGTCVL